MKALTTREAAVVAQFDRGTHLRVLGAFLCDGLTHREIQRRILGIPANPRGGGFIAMYILHAYGISGELRGVYRDSDPDILSRIERLPDKARKAAKHAIDYRTILEAQMAAIRNGRVPPQAEGRVSPRKVRPYQKAFREVVVGDYGGICGLCSISIDAMLIASHIAPWAELPEGRLDPRNAILLCALHDRLLDKGLMSLTDECEVIVSAALAEVSGLADLYRVKEGSRLRLPKEFFPARMFLAYHRGKKFIR